LTSSWTQVGADINGKTSGDKSGYASISSDGLTVAIGGSYNDENGKDSGHVRVFKNINNTWSQVGSDIYGEAEGDYSGLNGNLKLSDDGSTLVIGSPNNQGNGAYSGHVRVFKNINDTWTQVGGNIDGEAIGDQANNISISRDASVIAIGATGNDGNGTDSGHVRVFKNINDTWTQVGANINGETAGDRFGKSLALSSNGSLIAIGAQFTKNENKIDSGYVKIFKDKNGVWEQVGKNIEGKSEGDSFSGTSRSIAISDDGQIVAVAANKNDANGIDSGHVRIFKNINDTWTQIGADINGEAAGDKSGYSISLSNNGSIIAIGAGSNYGNGAKSGHVRVFKNINDTWTQVGADIDGEGAGDKSGGAGSVSLSGDGSILAIGARYNGENGVDSGHVRVFKLTEISSDKAINISTDSGKYLLIKEPKTFAEAVTASKSYGGNLAQFETEEEASHAWIEIQKIIPTIKEDFDKSTASDGGKASYLWIGGTDGDTESTTLSETWNWKWTQTGRVISKSRSEWGSGWGGDEPDNSRGIQHRLAMGLEDWSRGNPGKYGTSGQWNDISENNKLWFLVELNNDAVEISNKTIIDKITSTIETDSKNYSGSSSDYNFFNLGQNRYAIQSGSNYDEITGVSELKFSNKDFDLDKDIKGVFDQVTGLNTDSGEMFRLYNAAFARFPDADGLKYWIDQFSSGKNTRRVVAQSFLGSAEFTQKYGSDVSDETYVNNLYKNVLGRDADTEGLNYWVGNLSNGIETRYEALLGFAESAENKALFSQMTGFV